MHDCSRQVLYQTKSYTSAFNLIDSSEIKNTFCAHKQSIKHIENVILFQSQIRNVGERKSNLDNSEMLNVTPYVTSERYHKLNKKSSDKSVIRSTSTLFYDLDSLAKRHSYHCITDVSEGNNKSKNKDEVKNFKSEAIVQECATQMKPKVLTGKNLKENKKKIYKTFPNDSLLSSEIFLRDNDGNYTSYKSPSEDKCVNERHQKFWSFAKFQTEHTNPVSKEKKLKKKDRGKRTEDPCPCQLFSYACPCTNTKSLTELAKNSKSLTVADEVTSTLDVFIKETKCNKHKNKKLTDITTYENKRTSTVVVTKQSKEILSNQLHDWNTTSNMLRQKPEVVANAMKIKNTKKTRQVLCPNCKEMIDIMSTTEEEGSLNSKSSPLYRDHELPPTPAYTYQDSKDKSKIVESRDICNHEPQCELIPVCQILPTDNTYGNQNVTSKTGPIKPTPRVIRVTKGCRHHPPCTVVPSCQRVNVLNNNCEYIPPCLHRPRCVNLPLCAPLSKSIYYDETVGKPEEDLGHAECLHMHHTRCMPSNQNESLENQINRVQNTCEYLSECSPRFVLNSTLGCISPLASPCQPLPRPICNNCISEKSCQYDFYDWKQDIITPTKKSISNEDVVFIRDVGCQFRNKNYSPKGSIIQYNASSDSCNMNVDRYCTNYHTLRYEDKFTLPISGEELSVSTVTFSSTEIDSQCPTHGKHRNRDVQKVPPTGFVPKSTMSPFVAYSNTHPTANFYLSANDNFKEKLAKKNPSLNASFSMTKKRQNAFIVKSRSSFFKYKNILRKRRKSRTSQQSGINCNSKKMSQPF